MIEFSETVHSFACEIGNNTLMRRLNYKSND